MKTMLKRKRDQDYMKTMLKRKRDQDYTFKIEAPRVREHLSYVVEKLDSSSKQSARLFRPQSTFNDTEYMVPTPAQVLHPVTEDSDGTEYEDADSGDTTFPKDNDDTEYKEPDADECKHYIEHALPKDVTDLFHVALDRDMELVEFNNKYLTLKLRIGNPRHYPTSGSGRTLVIVAVYFKEQCRRRQGFDTIVTALTPLSKDNSLPILVECVVNQSFEQYMKASAKWVPVSEFQFGGGSYFLKDTLP
jgi:hypothetical protein